MATQGQRRAEAIAAIRKLRRIFRQIDTAGERVERELDRLIKRKTLIGPDQLETVMNRIAELVKLMTNLQDGSVLTWEVIANLPR